MISKGIQSILLASVATLIHASDEAKDLILDADTTSLFGFELESLVKIALGAGAILLVAFFLYSSKPDEFDRNYHIGRPVYNAPLPNKEKTTFAVFHSLEDAEKKYQ